MSVNRLLGSVTRFHRDADGNVAIMFAFGLVPALLMLGAAVDYTTALSQRGHLQHAVDSAVLAAAEASGGLTGAQAAANAAFAANFPAGGAILITQPTSSPGVTHGEATINIDTAFLKIGGINAISIGAVAETKAFANATAIEVALVLDTTGSMINDMPALKTAATNLTNTLFQSASSNPNFKMSVVPYVAAVNPGVAVMGANSYANMDTNATNVTNGGGMRGAYIATNTNTAFNASKAESSTNKRTCWSNWGSSSSSGSGGTGSLEPQDQLDPLNLIGKFANELFGIKPAYAFGETSNTAPTLTGTTVNRGASSTSSSNYNSKGQFGNGEFLPTGFGVQTNGRGADNSNFGCDWLTNPGTINYFDLFGRISPVTKTGGIFGGWKGCVEARPAPYDVTDDAPGSDPANIGVANSRFVPYFAPDEPDPFDTWVPAYHNNYLDDGYIDPAALLTATNKILGDPTGTRVGRTDNNRWDFKYNNWSRARSILKYNYSPTMTQPLLAAKADIKDFYDAPGNHITTGPNANCPDEVLPLTNNKANVLSKITSLQHWAGGGTIISEGLAWGWRSLSPNQPYALGKPYDAATVQKVIVLMTDGVTEVGTNNDDLGPIVSDYTSYGYLRDGRLGPNQTFAEARTVLGGRLDTVCANAKAKPGVSIYTVLFRETDPTVAAKMRACASSVDKAFTAADGAALNAAFGQISSSISKLHLSK